MTGSLSERKQLEIVARGGGGKMMSLVWDLYSLGST